MSSVSSSQASSPGAFGWIYRLAGPPEPPPDASFEAREIFRRGRLGSIIMVVMLLLCICSLPAGFVGTNPLLIPILGMLFVLTVCAIFFNRRGLVNLAGALMVIAFEGGILGNVSTTPGGLSTTALTLFSLLVMPEVLSVALLPAWTVFVDAAFNCLAIVLLVTFLPRAAGEASAISAAYFYAILLPFCIQVIVAFVTFLFVQGTIQAMARADRAEEVAQLERDLSERDRQAAQGAEQLHQSILLIDQALEAFANGNKQARVPLSQENVLWSIAGKINNVLQRFQRSTEAEIQLQVLLQAVQRNVHVVQEAKRSGAPMQLTRSGTPLDALSLELHGQVIHLPRAPQTPGPSHGRDERG